MGMGILHPGLPEDRCECALSNSHDSPAGCVPIPEKVWTVLSGVAGKREGIER